MDNQIERIAMEVAHRTCTTYNHVGFERYSFSVAQLAQFAHQFRDRIDAERGKEATAFIGICSDGGHICLQRDTKGMKVNSIQPLFLSPTIPEGMVPVPIEPTQAMIDVADFQFKGPRSDFVEIYRVMIAVTQGERK